jgi:hypothetical protein
MPSPWARMGSISTSIRAVRWSSSGWVGAAASCPAVVGYPCSRSLHGRRPNEGSQTSPGRAVSSAPVCGGSGYTPYASCPPSALGASREVRGVRGAGIRRQPLVIHSAVESLLRSLVGRRRISPSLYDDHGQTSGEGVRWHGWGWTRCVLLGARASCPLPTPSLAHQRIPQAKHRCIRRGLVL